MHSVKLYETIHYLQQSKSAALFLLIFIIISFIVGQIINDMSLFSSSGGIVTIYGVFFMVKFASIREYRRVHNLSDETPDETPELKDQRLKREIDNEVRGIFMSVFGTIIWAYGEYIPIL